MDKGASLEAVNAFGDGLAAFQVKININRKIRRSFMYNSLIFFANVMQMKLSLLLFIQNEKGTLTYGFDVAMRAVDPTNDDIESYDQACEKAISKGYSAMVDLTWGGWDAMQDVANANGFPYVRIDASNHQFIKVKYEHTIYVIILCNMTKE